MSNLIKIAHINKTHGLKGEITIFLLTENIDERFSKGKKVFIDDKEFTVKNLSFFKDNFYQLTLKEITSIEEAEKYVKKDICANKLTSSDIIYLDDIINFDVISPTDEKIGKIDDYTIINKTNYIIVNKKYIPLIKDVFYSKIDDSKKSIYLTEQGLDCYYNA